MAFPSLTPSSRSFKAGDWPVKTFRTQAGTETRILYGNRRTGMTLDLSYDNITDANAELFLDHYNEMLGSFTTFTIPSETKRGWKGNSDAIDAVDYGNRWKYSEEPSIESVKPGLSNVSISLIGVL